MYLTDGTHKKFEQGKRDGYKGKKKQSNGPEYALGWLEGVTLKMLGS